MYATMTSALAEEHVRNMRAQAASHERARQARQARRKQRTRHSLVTHEVPVRRRQAAARHA
jgi:hypothetical protein